MADLERIMDAKDVQSVAKFCRRNGAYICGRARKFDYLYIYGVPLNDFIYIIELCSPYNSTDIESYRVISRDYIGREEK